MATPERFKEEPEILLLVLDHLRALLSESVEGPKADGPRPTSWKRLSKASGPIDQ